MGRSDGWVPFDPNIKKKNKSKKIKSSLGMRSGVEHPSATSTYLYRVRPGSDLGSG